MERAITTNYIRSTIEILLNRGSSYIWPTDRLNYWLWNEERWTGRLAELLKLWYPIFETDESDDSRRRDGAVFVLSESVQSDRLSMELDRLWRERIPCMPRGWCNLCPECAPCSDRFCRLPTFFLSRSDNNFVRDNIRHDKIFYRCYLSIRRFEEGNFLPLLLRIILFSL